MVLFNKNVFGSPPEFNTGESQVAPIVTTIGGWNISDIIYDRQAVERRRREEEKRKLQEDAAVRESERIIRDAEIKTIPVVIARAKVSREQTKQLSGFDEIDDDILIMMMAMRR